MPVSPRDQNPSEFALVQGVKPNALAQLLSVSEALACIAATEITQSLGDLLILNASRDAVAESMGRRHFEVDMFMAALDLQYGEKTDLYLADWLTEVPLAARGRRRFYYQRNLALIVCAMHDGELDVLADVRDFFNLYVTHQLDISGIWFDVGVYLRRCQSMSSITQFDYLNDIFKPRLYYLTFKQAVRHFVISTASHFSFLVAMAESLMHFDFRQVFNFIECSFTENYSRVCAMTGYIPEYQVSHRLLAAADCFPFMQDCQQVLCQSADRFYAASRCRLRAATVGREDLYLIRGAHPLMQHLFDKEQGLIERPPQSLFELRLSP